MKLSSNFDDTNNKVEIHLVNSTTSETEKELTIENVVSLSDIENLLVSIKAQFSDFSGGIVTQAGREQEQDILFTDQNKIYDFLQVLSEGLNQPFISSQMANGKTIEAALQEAKEFYSWNLSYVGYNPGKDEYSVESLLTTGNGFMGLRGTVPEMKISTGNYPATYLASLYNTADSKVADATVSNEDFVNAPNMQYLALKIGEELIDIESNQVNYLKRTLNLKNGLFSSVALLETKDGKQVEIKSERIANMADMNHYSIRYTFKPLNFSEKVTLLSAADGDVYNYNVERYRSLESHHLDLVDLQAEGTKAILVSATKQSKFTIVQKSELLGDLVEGQEITNELQQNYLTQSVTIDVQKGQAYAVTKNVDVFLFNQGEEALATKESQTPIASRSFDEELAQSAAAWEKLWKKSTITITGDLMSEKMLHLHTYHILVSGSPNANPKLDASITARGLHGEAYRGHIFWDELFILPFYIIHFPETARQLLMYRYNRLAAAKKDALVAGYKGAMFPWQSGLDGTEQSQDLHLNPLNGEWGKDFSRLQRHVSLAVAYNVWLYWNNTDDKEYMQQYGSELLLEIAHFWESAATFDEATGRYSIDKVMGPDEFHEAYPGKEEEGGLKDNAYTNMMVVWLFEQVKALPTIIGDTEFTIVAEKVGLTPTDLIKMNEMKHKLALEINPEGIIAQFDGYFDLKEIDWDYYQEKYGNIYRMDRILKAEGESADDYKVAKQADTLMIFYNFAKTKVDEILKDLTYTLPTDYLEKNLEYYLKRTSHGSTLSRVVHSQLAAIAGNADLAWQLYQEALYSDYRDIQGGTTAEGIHAGVMAATIFITLSTFAGVDIRNNEVTIAPNLPKQWQDIQFGLTIKNVNYQIDLNHTTLTIQADQATTISVLGKSYALLANQTETVYY